MTKITDIRTPWRDQWRQASYRAVPFFVANDARGGGRRTVLHEYPKRDTPQSEDMGRRGKTFTVIGYLIGPNSFVGDGDYRTDRDALENALDDVNSQGPGILVLPTRADMRVTYVRYQTSERREQGGYCEIEMTFVEAGAKGAGVTSVTQTGVIVGQTAAQAAAAAGQAFNNASTDPPAPFTTGAP